MIKFVFVLFFIVFSVAAAPVNADNDDYYQTPRWAPPLWNNHNPRWNTPHPDFYVIPKQHVIPHPSYRDYHPRFNHQRFHGTRRTNCRDIWHNGKLYRQCESNNPLFFLSTPNFSPASETPVPLWGGDEWRAYCKY